MVIMLYSLALKIAIELDLNNITIDENLTLINNNKQQETPSVINRIKPTEHRKLK